MYSKSGKLLVSFSENSGPDSAKQFGFPIGKGRGNSSHLGHLAKYEALLHPEIDQHGDEAPEFARFAVQVEDGEQLPGEAHLGATEDHVQFAEEDGEHENPAESEGAKDAEQSVQHVRLDLCTVGGMVDRVRMTVGGATQVHVAGSHGVVASGCISDSQAISCVRGG